MNNLLARWLPLIQNMAATDERFRFAALIGSYARNETPADSYSDLDLITAFENPDRMFSDTSWLNDFGDPKIVFSHDLPAFGVRECRALFKDGAMLDVVISPSKNYSDILYDAGTLAICRRGCRILVDKDGLANSPRFDLDQIPPEESREDMIRRFQNTVRSFWFHVVWTRMKLKRGETMQSMGCVDRLMKDLLFDILRMKAKLIGGSASDTWHEGRFFEKWVEKDDLELMRHAFAHYNEEDIYAALERTAELFAKVAREASVLLDTSYPDDVECFARQSEVPSATPAHEERRPVVRHLPLRDAESVQESSEEVVAPLDPVIRSAYLCVQDMERAIAFYRRFLEIEPVEKDEIYSVFDVAGFRLGLFAYEKMGEAHTFGDNCLLSIEVGSEANLREKLKNVEVVYGPKPIGRFLVVEILDCEGNRIEITAQRESAG